MDIVVAAADVGGIGNFGWACLDGRARRTGSDLRGLADEVANFLKGGYPVALGFEAPLFVPAVEDAGEVLKAREGEWVYVTSPRGTRVKSGRSWSASAGAMSLLLALQQSEWLFHELSRLVRGVRVGYSLNDLASGLIDLMVWEAFLSGEEAKAEASRLAAEDVTVEGPHQADAALMTESFRSRYPDDITHDITSNVVVGSKKARRVLQRTPFPIVGASLLRSGLTDDINLLTACPIALRIPKASPEAESSSGADQ